MQVIHNKNTNRYGTFRMLQAFGLSIILVMCLSCSIGASKMEVVEYRNMPVEVWVPVSNMRQRVGGDPGSSAELPLPGHLYVYIVVTGQSPDDVSVTCQHFAGIEDDWVPDRENLYHYGGKLNLPIVENATARIYAVASKDELQLGSQPVTEDDVRNLVLDMTKPDNLNINLRDVYSAPQNGEGIEIEGYGENNDNIWVSAVCYHVGAKVDFMWNLTETFLAAYPKGRVVSLGLTGLPQKGYLFRPMENKPLSGAETGVWEFPLEEGNNIYGRTDTYVFQSSGGQLNWQVTMTDDASVQAPVTERTDGTASPEVVPGSVAWYRLYFTINSLKGINL